MADDAPTIPVDEPSDTHVEAPTLLSDDCADAGLSDAAVRTHIEAIEWLYAREQMNLVFKARMLRRVAGTANPDAAMAELVAAGFWAPVSGGWTLVHHEDVVRASLAMQIRHREAFRVLDC